MKIWYLHVLTIRFLIFIIPLCIKTCFTFYIDTLSFIYFHNWRFVSCQGSTVQRQASPKEKLKEFPTFKDNDFVKDNVKIYLSSEDRSDFLPKLKADVNVSNVLKPVKFYI